MAKFAILQSLRLVFESRDCFLEKGEIYLSAVKTYQQMGEMYVEQLEQPMLLTIKEKVTWKRPEEVILVAQIYQTIYKTRLYNLDARKCYLRFVVTRIFRTSSRTQVWTKKINETVDLMYELYHFSKTDVDNTAITWYYALCMELLLDAAMILEPYEACHDFYARSKNFFVHILECYLLIIHRGINIRRMNDLFSRSSNIKTIIKSLHNASSYAPFVKPFLYLLQSYMEIVQGRKILSRMNMKKSRKFATAQENKLVLALLEQSKRVTNDYI
ncbi:hypothetical protein E2986_11112 [Frieseomelitta varia]|uniref:Uncharacterized protein n=1 Tax=Frieseomelitta varia TaxID=561572 RepID=A0A833SFG3_9HYME|nr:hypothetical protein E2986_11112 [Frieseomelitta varia]